MWPNLAAILPFKSSLAHEVRKPSFGQTEVDTGLARFLSGYRSANTGFLFENAVYLQLLHEGWQIHVGKLYGKEIDFIAVKDGAIRYIQVAEEIFVESTRERELAPLKAIRDNHAKIIVVRQGSYEPDVDGIVIESARNFFCGQRDFRRHY